MIQQSKYGFNHQDIVRYTYKELQNNDVATLIENAIQNSDIEVVQTISTVRATKIFRGFKTSDEHITTIKLEAAAYTAKLAEKYGLPLNKKSNTKPF